MNDAISAGLANFERVLRWVYSGGLFWIVLPLVFVDLDDVGKDLRFGGFYGDMLAFGHIAIIGVSGFLIYLTQRYLIHDLLLNWFFMIIGVGAAVNFRHAGKIRRFLYSCAVPGLLWVRFGRRPFGSTELWERTESRFDRYMASRMAAIHALGSTFVVLVTVRVIAGLSIKDSVFDHWSDRSWDIYWVVLVVIAGVWFLQSLIATKGEQSHYQKPAQSRALPTVVDRVNPNVDGSEDSHQASNLKLARDRFGQLGLIAFIGVGLSLAGLGIPDDHVPDWKWIPGFLQWRIPDAIYTVMGFIFLGVALLSLSAALAAILSRQVGHFITRFQNIVDWLLMVSRVITMGEVILSWRSMQGVLPSNLGGHFFIWGGLIAKLFAIVLVATEFYPKV